MCNKERKEKQSNLFMKKMFNARLKKKQKKPTDFPPPIILYLINTLSASDLSQIVLAL